MAGLFTLAIPNTPANAFNDFQVCAGELRRSNISPEVAAAACAEALAPADLSLCVLKIKALTPISPDDALRACIRVRRPIELANCVVQINDRTQDPNALPVLNYCRRSLLPERFSDCVVGISRQLDFSPPSALEACISAEDYPL